MGTSCWLCRAGRQAAPRGFPSQVTGEHPAGGRGDSTCSGTPAPWRRTRQWISQKRSSCPSAPGLCWGGWVVVDGLSRVLGTSTGALLDVEPGGAARSRWRGWLPCSSLWAGETLASTPHRPQGTITGGRDRGTWLRSPFAQKTAAGGHTTTKTRRVACSRESL